jgi:hypothetical protein
MKLDIIAPMAKIRKARKNTNCLKTVERPYVSVSTLVDTRKSKRSLKSSRESVEETTIASVIITKLV